MPHPDPNATAEPTTIATPPAPPAAAPAAADVLVEDVSIDGMCGVY